MVSDIMDWTSRARIEGFNAAAEIYEKEQSRLELLLIEQTEKVVKLKEQVGPLVKALEDECSCSDAPGAVEICNPCETLKRLGFLNGSK